MIVAESCDLIRKTSTKTEKGALSHTLGSYYCEFQIINYLGEDIFALDAENQVVKIKPQEGSTAVREEDRCVIIQSRHAQGPRIIGSMAIELTPSTHYSITIPRSVFVNDAVYVGDINALLYNPRWHPTKILHPQSKEFIQQEQDRIIAQIGRDAVYSPITIMANDPTGKIKFLYIELNGRVCAAKVTNFDTDRYESDVVAICIRDSESGGIDDCKIVRTSFSELFRANPICWNIEGFLISSDKAWLINKIRVDQIKPIPKTVPTEEVNYLLTKARAEDAETILSLEEIIKVKDGDIKEWSNRYKALRESFDDLIKGGYIDRNSTVAFKRISLEESKVQAAVEEAKLSQTTERLKLTKEQIATIAVIAKTIAVIVPLIGLYIKFKQKSTA